MVPISISDSDELLIIAPHPDDECIGVGGILCQYPDKCTVYVLTDGAQGQGNMSSEECRENRRQEFISEMRFLGLNNYVFLNISDGTLMNHVDCIEHVKLENYTKIFVTGLYDGHTDHSAALYCVLNALKKQVICKADVYLYEVHNELLNPTNFMDITDFIDKKIQAVRFHKSQLNAVRYDRLIELNAELRAIQHRQAGVFWEVYEKVNLDTYLHFETNNAIESELSKFKQFYQVLTKWMLNDKQKKLEKLLIEKYALSECIIYGYAELGQILEKRLSDTSICIKNVMDKKITGFSKKGIKIIKPNDVYDKNIPIVVTAIFYYGEIRKELKELGFKKIYSLYEIITSL